MDKFNELYQTLGAAWEYFGLMCQHKKGYRKLKDKEGRWACRICGKIKNSPAWEYLLPVHGAKVIGQYVGTPNRKSKTFPDKQKARLVDDAIYFHGARLNVRVHHSYPSSLLDKKINIAADRIVELQEKEVRVWIDSHLVDVEIAKGKADKGKKYGGFVWELPKKLLKKFPIICSYGPQGQFYGVEIFRPK